MANTYSQIYIQTVFAVSNRMSLIKPAFKEDLYKYITGIVTNQGQKLISINGMSDHLHILIGVQPAIALANLVRASAFSAGSNFSSAYRDSIDSC